MSKALNIHELYRFFYVHPVNGSTQCYPAIGSLETEWQKEDQQIFWRKLINQDLIFINDPKRSVTDFDDLHALERSDDLCTKLNFTVEMKCGEVWEEWFTGYIALVDGEFDVDKCRIDIPVRVEDEYSCIFNKLKEDQDFIGGVGAPADVGEIEFQDFEKEICCEDIFEPQEVPIEDLEGLPPLDYCLDNVDNWFFSHNVVNFLGEVEIQGETEYHYSFCSHWVRQTIASDCENGIPVQPPGDGWQILENNCPTGAVWFRNPLVFGGGTGLVSPPDLINGRNFAEVIQYMISDCNLTLVSDFFNHNSDGTAPDNSAYQYAAEFFLDLVIFQITDVKISGDYEPATKAIITLEDIFEELRTIFNAYWVIEGGVMRIEHISYFQQENRMLDLTTDEEKKWIQGRHKYSYNTDDLPRLENFEWAAQSDELDQNDFDGGKIKYSDTCSFGDDSADVDYRSSFVTNVLDVYENPENYPDNSFVLVGTVGGLITAKQGGVSGEIRLNGGLAWSNLLPELHIWNRPQSNGEINGVETIFQSSLRQREQDTIQFPICCSDLINTFDPADLVLTQLGWGEISSVNYRDPVGVMEIVLKHK